MKILFLNGSPRHNGNTHTVLQMIKELETFHSLEFIDVCTLKLNGCMACDSCKDNGGHCISLDESDMVIQKILEADIIIFGTPVYWWGVSAQLKIIIDKFYSQDEILKTMRKKIGIIAIGANDIKNPQYRLIHEQFSCIAEYLHWELLFFKAFSAYKPGEILNYTNLNSEIKEILNF